MSHHPGSPWTGFLLWIWWVNLILIALYTSWHTGVLPAMFETDQTRLSVLIVLVFLGMLLHSGWRSLVLTRWERDRLPVTRGITESLQAEVLAEQLRGPNQVGWFVVGALLKLGLLGTVIGFVLMLSSVGSLDSLDISQVQRLMQSMTQGMRIALNTTILGLLSSLVLGMLYLMLDRRADGLLARVTESAETA